LTGLDPGDYALAETTVEKSTPMMAQYQRAKDENPDAIVFFRLGDFYEIFGEDAKEASRLLEITLTARSSGEGRVNKVPMCGVPYHAVDNYINRLLKAGRKVAIVEQMEDPRKTKTMVRRELVRIITPGTILSPESLEAKQNNYLAAVAAGEGTLGLAAVDLSTGEFLVTEFSGAQAVETLLIELNRFHPAEILVPEEFSPAILERLSRLDSTYLSRQASYRFDPDAGRAGLSEHFGAESLEGFGCHNLSIGLGAAAAALHYLAETQRGALNHIRRITTYQISTHMILDDNSIRNLELIRNSVDGSRKNTLLDCLDFTLTAMGGRCLHRWILRPLLSLESIQERQLAVSELTRSVVLRQNLNNVLGKMHDLERLAGRIGAGTANPRDLLALRMSFEKLPDIKTIMAGTHSILLNQMAAGMPECKEVRDLLTTSIADEPPVSSKEGGIIRSGYHREVDELRSLAKEGKGFIANLQAREKERTGITSLKVEFNSVFGYYIEVSKANLKLIPDDYQRKQTLANAERYITQELKEYETKVLGAQDKLVELEYDLFIQIRNQAAAKIQDILVAAGSVATLDALLSLAEAAVRYQYIQPQIDDSGRIDIQDGRHPVVERLTREKFVPNDTRLDLAQNQVLIITGPNMAGKSTFLRQTALIVIMAQIGGFVPAAQARIGMIDRVFTRVGAADNLAGGQSTFMVEMNETANILCHATTRSLVILDEVGRGTSTFDGVSIAWAVAEYLHDFIGAKTLFATHYFELTELALSKDRVKNFNIAVREWKDEIIFLRKILEGSTDRSYGIQVARLAGLPSPVIIRAREILVNLERANYTEAGNSRLAVHSGDDAKTVQKNLFDQGTLGEIIRDLEQLKVDQMTPLEALNQLAELKNKYSK
jgi:DNA mismatch repair protein MutS